MKNKLPEVESVIKEYKPHIFGVSESYFKKIHDIEDIKIPNYNVFLSKTLENPNLNVSRLAVFVHEELVKANLRTDLMDDKFSSVWLEVGLKGQKTILIGNVYREWQYLEQNDDNSVTIDAQFDRFERFIEKWELALGTSKECHLLGDMNLNFLEYSKQKIPLNSQSYKLR